MIRDDPSCSGLVQDSRCFSSAAYKILGSGSDRRFHPANGECGPELARFILLVANQSKVVRIKAIKVGH